MDVFDQATEQEEKAREQALAAVRNQAPLLMPIGVCHNCGNDLIRDDTAASCFCDADCRDDWQARNPNR
jgi:hypothetical protein